jgi:hypothetical protein
MRDRIRLGLTFDPVRLRDDLARLEESLWIDHFVRQNYEGSWSAIPLRAARGAEHPIRMIYCDPTCTEFVDTPFLEASPYLREVLAAFECRLQTVRLMRLTPGSIIREHADPDLSAEQGLARLHIPVTTNPDVEFCVNGRPVMMSEGECWYLRLSDPHRAANRGTTDRVHMVIDARVDDWLLERLREAESDVPESEKMSG